MGRKKKASPLLDEADVGVDGETDARKMIDGRAFLRAVAFALKCCPDGEGTAHLAHVCFVGNEVVCADGERWHVGIYPVGVALPFVAPRTAVKKLMIHLAYADKVSRADGGSWSVEVKVWDESEGDAATRRMMVRFEGGKSLPPIEVDLTRCEVGYVPSEWTPPVAETAELADESKEYPEISCENMRVAMSWYRSWDRDHGIFRQRVDEHGVMRIDIFAGGNPVAAAFLLPRTMPKARLPMSEPLFDRANPDAKPVGQSILDLVVDRDGKPFEEPEEDEDEDDTGEDPDAGLDNN
jgi:hypothetical protein